MRTLVETESQEFRREFIEFAVKRGVLRFGEFKTKAGRMSPYFFNAGLFNDGEALRRLGQFYAKAILAGGIPFDLLFGPAYKGIPLATATAVALDEVGRNVPICFNRKEAKDHGEGGMTIGAPLAGRVLVIDNLGKDSNGDLRFTFNSSGLTPGQYRVRVEGLPFRGDPIGMAWFIIDAA